MGASRQRLRISTAARRPSSVFDGGHADVSDDQLGTQLECTGYQFGSTPDGGDHLVTAVAQEQC